MLWMRCLRTARAASGPQQAASGWASRIDVPAFKTKGEWHAAVPGADRLERLGRQAGSVDPPAGRPYTVTKERRATYANLPPGGYTFLVRASTNDALWNAEPTSYSFVITPPLWQTWWFYASCLLGALGGVVGGREGSARVVYDDILQAVCGV